MLFYKQDFYNYHSFYTQTFLYGLIPPPPPPLSHNFFDTPSMIFKKITTPINKAGGGSPINITYDLLWQS